MAKKKNLGSVIGAWAFLIGVILAVILGIFSAQLTTASNAILSILVIAGILVGLLNVGSKDSTSFLLAAVSLVIVAYLGDTAISALGAVALIGPMLSNILNALLVLFVPTAIIVALRVVFEIAKKS